MTWIDEWQPREFGDIERVSYFQQGSIIEQIGLIVTLIDGREFVITEDDMRDGKRIFYDFVDWLESHQAGFGPLMQALYVCAKEVKPTAIYLKSVGLREV